MNDMILLKVGEIILKGLNRRRFEQKLLGNIRWRLSRIGKFKVYILQSAIYVEAAEENADMDAAFEELRHVFGVVAISRAAACAKDKDAIAEMAKTYLREEMLHAKSFKVETRRSDKSFPLTSVQLSQYVGGELDDAFPDCAVDVRCDAFLSKSYIPSAPQRMDMYKRIARVENEADYDDMLDEMCDRFGEPDSAAVNLCRVARIRALGRRAGISKVEERDGTVRLYLRDINGTALHRLGEVYPSLGVRASLGQAPYISMKTKKTMRNTEFLIELLETYVGLLGA